MGVVYLMKYVIFMYTLFSNQVSILHPKREILNQIQLPSNFQDISITNVEQRPVFHRDYREKKKQFSLMNKLTTRWRPSLFFLG